MNLSNQIDLSGLGRLGSKLRSLLHLDATELMYTWMRIIDEDNRKGILAGLDKDGVPMQPVTYRPKTPGSSYWLLSDKRLKLQAHQRLNQRGNVRKGEFAGFGVWSSGINNNLTTAEYTLLGGPPLAPRRQFSRTITNLATKFGQLNSGTWYAAGVWDEVVDKKGRPFLTYHFDGVGQKRRDLRGVRPAGIAKARAALRNWAHDKVRQHLEGTASGPIEPVQL